jgi:hypothetical protein
MVNIESRFKKEREVEFNSEEKTYFKAIGSLVVRNSIPYMKPKDEQLLRRNISEHVNKTEDRQIERAENLINVNNAKQLLLKSKIFREKSVNSPEQLKKMHGKRIFNGEEKTIEEIYEAILPHNMSISKL